MPAVDDPFSIAASLPGQMATIKSQMKDLSVSNTQALSQALAAATASAASASAAATALQASVVTPVTTIATSTSSSFPFTLTATMVVPPRATRCFYTATASVFVTASSGFQVQFNVSAPSTGSYGNVSGSSGASSDTSSAMGTLTGLTPGATVSFTGYIGTGGTYSAITGCNTRVQALAVFQP